MSDLTFPSGPWVGFYTYTNHPRRYLMDLVLAFREGTITGDGADGIGFFVIDGRYSAQSGDCTWAKTYVGRHSVAYRGYREGKGIWGTWSLQHTTGGFHIWPIGQGGELEALRAEAEVATPLAPALPVASR